MTRLPIAIPCCTPSCLEGVEAQLSCSFPAQHGTNDSGASGSSYATAKTQCELRGKTPSALAVTTYVLSIVTSTAKTAPAFSPGGLYLNQRRQDIDKGRFEVCRKSRTDIPKSPCSCLQPRRVPTRSQVSVLMRFTSPSLPHVMKKSPHSTPFTPHCNDFAHA